MEINSLCRIQDRMTQTLFARCVFSFELIIRIVQFVLNGKNDRFFSAIDIDCVILRKNRIQHGLRTKDRDNHARLSFFLYICLIKFSFSIDDAATSPSSLKDTFVLCSF